jgi:hypothetical protein
MQRSIAWRHGMGDKLFDKKSLSSLPFIPNEDKEVEDVEGEQLLALEASLEQASINLLLYNNEEEEE